GVEVKVGVEICKEGVVGAIVTVLLIGGDDVGIFVPVDDPAISVPLTRVDDVGPGTIAVAVGVPPNNKLLATPKATSKSKITPIMGI
ncbi:MAG: hypothetical protein HC875_34145, partial [Anaerolineales bacterium]|nr:hypothetical protein [Anaerolineales bacterium]